MTLFMSSCQGARYIEINFDTTEMSSLEDIENYTNLSLQGEGFEVDAIAIFIENYFLESQTNFNNKMIKYEELTSLFEAGKTKNLPPPPITDHSELIRHLNRLTAKFKNNPAIAPIVYTIAYSYFEDGKLDKSIETFETFLTDYKTSHLRDEVAFRLGELYFDTGRIDRSLESYNKISKRVNSPFYIRGEFKKAWLHYRLDNFDKSVKTFKTVIDSGLKKGRDRPSLDLSDESKKTVVKIFSQLKPTSELSYNSLLEKNIEGFRSSPYAPDLLSSLGALLKSQSRFEEMESPYKIFTERYKKHKKIPFAYNGLAEAYNLQGKNELSIEARTLLINKFKPGSKWYKGHFKKGDDPTDNIISKNMVIVGNHHRDLAATLEIKNPENANKELVKAIGFYKEHLKYFESRDLASSTTLSLAEALFSIKSYEEAAHYYTMAMEHNRSNENGDKAALSALLTYELLITEEINKSEDKKISPEKTKHLAGKIYYVENYFRDGFIGSPVEVKFYTKTSDMYFVLNVYDKALESLNSLLYAKGGGRDVYEKIGDAHSNLKNIDKGIENYKLAKQFRSGKGDKSLNEKLSSLYYSKAQAFKAAAGTGRAIEAGSNKEAIENYYNAFRVNKDSLIGENSILNIGKIYIEEENIIEVTTITQLMKRYYSRSLNYPTFLVDAAKLLKSKSRFEDASDLLESAALRTTDKANKQIYIFESLALLDFAGQSPTLIRKLKTYMNSGVISESRNTQALFMLGVALVKSGDKRRGIESLKKAIDEKPTPENDYFRTKARLQIAAVKTEDFVKLRLTLPFDKSFAKKEKLMRDILGDYKYALETKIADLLPETFYYMGKVLENLSSSLIESERPKGLSEEETEEYSFQLEEKAYPIDEEAIKSYRNSVKASTEHKLSTKFTQLSINRLSALRPASFSRPLEQPGPIFIDYLEGDIKPLPLNEYTGGHINPNNLPTSAKAIVSYNKGIKVFSKKPKKAISYFNDAIKIMPGFSESYLMKGRAHLKLGREDAQVEAFQAFKASTEGARELGEGHSSMGILHYKNGDIDRAEESFEKSVTLSDGSSALINLANINFIKENFKLAYKYYKMAERISPEDDYLEYNLGISLYKRGDIKKSAAYLENSLPLIKEKPEKAVEVATAILLSGRVDKALKTLINIKKLNPNNKETYKVLGVIYEIYKNDYKAAVANYNKYLDLTEKQSGETDISKDQVNTWITIAKQKDKK